MGIRAHSLPATATLCTHASQLHGNLHRSKKNTRDDGNAFRYRYSNLKGNAVRNIRRPPSPSCTAARAPRPDAPQSAPPAPTANSPVGRAVFANPTCRCLCGTPAPGCGLRRCHYSTPSSNIAPHSIWSPPTLPIWSAPASTLLCPPLGALHQPGRCFSLTHRDAPRPKQEDYNPSGR